MAGLDQFLQHHPQDGVVAVERCRFIDAFSDEDAPSIEGAAEDSEQCHQALAKGALAPLPVVKLFLWENDWSKAAITQGEAMLAQPSEWSVAQRAQINESLANRYRSTDLLKSGAHSLSAVELDPSSSQRLPAAEYLVKIGGEQRAAVLIQGMPRDQWKSWTLRSAVNTLIGMDKAKEAMGLVQLRDDLKLDAQTRVKLANALLQAGENAQARGLMNALLAETHPETTSSGDLDRELFEFQRDHGDQTSAVAAYRKLRDKGYWADPYARYRLSLLLRYPGAPWTFADLAGIGTLLLHLALLALLPLLVIMLLHYRGAVRRARGEVLEGASELSPWGLGHLWYALAVITVCSGVAMYVYCYPLFENPLRSRLAKGVVHAAFTPDSHALAHAVLLIESGCALGLIPLLRRARLVPMLIGQWPPRTSLLRGFCSSIVLLVVARILTQVLNAPPAAPGIALDSNTIRAMQGIYALYGASGLLFIAALLAPFFEEFVFRGVFLRVASRHVPIVIATVFQALVFISLHDQSGTYVLLFMLATLAAWLAWRSGGLLAPMTLHITNNVFASLAIMGIAHIANTTP